MTNPLDEGAIPSTSTTYPANQEEDLEVEDYIYENSQLVRIAD